MSYDSLPDTTQHIGRVRDLLRAVRVNLIVRAKVHDESKLKDPEKEIFDEFTPKLKGSTYGSPEYMGFLSAMRPALEHHYAHNSHHPEFFANGVDGMSLLDIIEMLCDWKAATERHADGCLEKSIQINAQRFSLSPQLVNILQNTRREMGW